MSKVKSAVDIYKREGFRSLISSVASYAYNQLKIQAIGCQLMSKLQGEKSHQVGSCTITVPLRERYQIDRFCVIHNEKKLIEDMVKELRQDDIVYDVGAYLGWHTLTAASIVSEGVTVGFEPHPKSYNRLTDTIQTAARGPVQLYNVAISDEDGTGKISKKSSASAKLTDRKQESDTTEVEIVCGDKFIRRKNIPYPTVVKIDVEGSEVPALRGLEEAISQKCRLVYCELHPEIAPEGKVVNDEVRSILEQNGFTVQLLEHSSSKEIIKATNERKKSLSHR